MSSTSSESLPSPFTPVGSVLGEGSTSLRMADHELQVATYVAIGFSYKKIGNLLGISTSNVGACVARLAQRIPGEGNPRQRVSAWMWVYGSESVGNGRQ